MATSATRKYSIALAILNGAKPSRPERSRDLIEISSPDFPGERLIVCRNHALAKERARNQSIKTSI
jgi:hypothetical protein